MGLIVALGLFGALLLILGALSAYKAAEMRGAMQVLISIPACIPIGITLSYLYMNLNCYQVNDYYCGFSFFLATPVGIAITFFIMPFLPHAIFKPLAGFSLGAGFMMLALLYVPAVRNRIEPEFWWVYVSISAVTGIILAYLIAETNKASEQKAK